MIIRRSPQPHITAASPPPNETIEKCQFLNVQKKIPLKITDVSAEAEVEALIQTSAAIGETWVTQQPPDPHLRNAPAADSAYRRAPAG